MATLNVNSIRAVPVSLTGWGLAQHKYAACSCRIVNRTGYARHRWDPRDNRPHWLTVQICTELINCQAVPAGADHGMLKA
jgi:hypothetical protein